MGGLRLARRCGAVVIGLWLVAGTACGGCAGPVRQARSVGEVEAVPVRVAAAAAGVVEKRVRLSGAVSAAESVVVVSKTAGKVEKVFAELGEAVKAGQILATLEKKDLELQTKQARAALEAARANLARLEKGPQPGEIRQLEAAVAQAEAASNAARVNYERMGYLLEQGAVSRQQFEAAETQRRVAEAQFIMAREQLEMAKAGSPPEVLDAARAQVKQAEAAYELAGSLLASAEIRAPIEGKVSLVRAQEGELVGTGAVLFGIVRLDPACVEIGLPERLVRGVSVGQELLLGVPSATADELRGTVTHVAPAADPQTRLFKLRLRVPNPDMILRPGMFAEVFVVEARVEDATVIPQECLLENGGKTRVFVVENGIAREREVRVALKDGANAAVVDGLGVGEIVVVSGQHFLKDGSCVKVIPGVSTGVPAQTGD